MDNRKPFTIPSIGLATAVLAFLYGIFHRRIFAEIPGVFEILPYKLGYPFMNYGAPFAPAMLVGVVATLCVQPFRKLGGIARFGCNCTLVAFSLGLLFYLFMSFQLDQEIQAQKRQLELTIQRNERDSARQQP